MHGGEELHVHGGEELHLQCGETVVHLLSCKYLLRRAPTQWFQAVVVVVVVAVAVVPIALKEFGSLMFAS